MDFSRRRMSRVVSLAILATVVCLVCGVLAGFGIANVDDLKLTGNLGKVQLALPTRVLDRNGKLITEFVASEQRQLITLDQLPKYVIYALITREDRNFFHEGAFSIRGTFRAAWNLLTGQYVSGGSTLTQQLAGTLYANRANFTIGRKLKELWYALNLERQLSKDEILQLYLNKMLFGPGVYGIQAASEFYFNHPAQELTIAESAMLVIQLANPSYYDPFRFPNRARDRQKTVLDQMVTLGYATQREVDASFKSFWEHFDYTRPNTYVAQDTVSSKAPYFTNYVRKLLQSKYLLGKANIYRDGYVVHTTLDLNDQAAAETYFHQGLNEINNDYDKSHSTRIDYAASKISPLVDMLSLQFNIPQIHVGNREHVQQAYRDFQADLLPLMTVADELFMGEGDGFTDAAHRANAQKIVRLKQSSVEGALVTLDNTTGEIRAMIGGADFEPNVNAFNYAVDGRVQPGSSFKPLYYSAAIQKHVITPATMIQDSRIVYTNDDGTPYKPRNFMGEWTPPVLARTALMLSMNVPSIRVLSKVGFTDAFATATALLGIPRSKMIERGFVRKYPVGLGTVSVAPIEMARAYATIANSGREVIPIAIKYVEDRNGMIIAAPEKDTLNRITHMGKSAQIITPQTAYIMQSMMHSTTTDGTLWYAFTHTGIDPNTPIEYAGKTGTTQNWSSVWTMGFTPYYTTALWYGFNTPGRSLGVHVLGGGTAGPIWAQYMQTINSDEPPAQFPEPPGIVHEKVTASTGQIPPPGYNGKVIDEVFIAGTQPKNYDTLSSYQNDQQAALESRMAADLTSPQVPVLPRSASLASTNLQLPDLGLELNLSAGAVSSQPAAPASLKPARSQGSAASAGTSASTDSGNSAGSASTPGSQKSTNGTNSTSATNNGGTDATKNTLLN